MVYRISKRLMKFVTILTILFSICFIMGGIDYVRVFGFYDKPFFAQCQFIADDGISGTYIGMGYTIRLQGNVMLEQKSSDINYAEFLILGNSIKHIEKK